MKIKPSYKAMYKAVRCNKAKIISIVSLDIIQVICEGGLIASTYLLLNSIQNSTNISENIAIPGSDQVFTLLKVLNLNNQISSFLILMIIFSIVQSICRYLSQLNIQFIGAWIQEKINFDITRIVLDTNFENIGSLRTGKLLTIGFESPEAIKNQLEIIACSLISILFLFLYARVLITLSVKEFIIALLTSLLIGSIQLFTFKKVKQKSTILSESKAELNNLMAELIRGKKYIKASGAVDFIKERLEILSHKLKENLFNQALIYELTAPLSKLLGVFVVVLVFQLFTISIINNDILLPTIGIFIVTLQRLIGKISELGQLNNNFNLNKGRIKLYDELIEKNLYYEFSKFKSFRDNRRSKIRKSIKVKNIQLVDLSYKYPNNDKKVLTNINLNLSKGEIVGIVGRSGSGKSTLLNIICGLIKYKSGSYLINEYKKEDLDFFAEDIISIVSQDSFTIHGSIYENIVWDQIPNRARALKCLENIDNLGFIKGLDKGIDTIIGEGGISISGGQTQLICMARALYKNSDILILDEATNALDSKTEKSIFKLIKKISKEKIIFIVSHDIENIKLCSDIFLLKDCKLTKQRNYDELIKNLKYS